MTAVYDGLELRLEGLVLDPEDPRRRLVTSILVLPGVTSIPDGHWGSSSGAFQGCRLATSISLPPQVVSIGSAAFNGCVSLASISLPESLKRIGTGAFYGCASLGKTALPKGLTTIEGSAFSGCEKVSFDILPESLTFLGHDAFAGCPQVLESPWCGGGEEGGGVEVGTGERRGGGVGVGKEPSTCTPSSSYVQHARCVVQRRRRLRYAVLKSLLRRRTLEERGAGVEGGMVGGSTGALPLARPVSDTTCVPSSDENEDAAFASAAVERRKRGGGGADDAQQRRGSWLEGEVAFQIITSDDLWRYLLEFV